MKLTVFPAVPTDKRRTGAGLSGASGAADDLSGYPLLQRLEPQLSLEEATQDSSRRPRGRHDPFGAVAGRAVRFGEETACAGVSCAGGSGTAPTRA
jgi:hypothetical protein